MNNMRQFFDWYIHEKPSIEVAQHRSHGKLTRPEARAFISAQRLAANIINDSHQLQGSAMLDPIDAFIKYPEYVRDLSFKILDAAQSLLIPEKKAD